MTRKDYIALAAALRASQDRHREVLGGYSVLWDATERIADVLAADNPRFDRVRFYEAAGLVYAEPVEQDDSLVLAFPATPDAEGRDARFTRTDDGHEDPRDYE